MLMMMMMMMLMMVMEAMMVVTMMRFMTKMMMLILMMVMIMIERMVLFHIPFHLYSVLYFVFCSGQSLRTRMFSVYKLHLRNWDADVSIHAFNFQVPLSRGYACVFSPILATRHTLEILRWLHAATKMLRHFSCYDVIFFRDSSSSKMVHWAILE